MASDKSVTEHLAQLLLLPKFPPTATIIAGEAIAIDGLLMQHPHTRGKKLDYGGFFDLYEPLMRQCEAVVKKFSDPRAFSDVQGYESLITDLTNIKNKLIDIEKSGTPLNENP